MSLQGLGREHEYKTRYTHVEFGKDVKNRDADFEQEHKELWNYRNICGHLEVSDQSKMPRDSHLSEIRKEIKENQALNIFII